MYFVENIVIFYFENILYRFFEPFRRSHKKFTSQYILTDEDGEKTLYKILFSSLKFYDIIFKYDNHIPRSGVRKNPARRHGHCL